jgi:hypothetical protein
VLRAFVLLRFKEEIGFGCLFVRASSATQLCEETSQKSLPVRFLQSVEEFRLIVAEELTKSMDGSGIFSQILDALVHVELLHNRVKPKLELQSNIVERPSSPTSEVNGRCVPFIDSERAISGHQSPKITASLSNDLVDHALGGTCSRVAVMVYDSTNSIDPKLA